MKIKSFKLFESSDIEDYFLDFIDNSDNKWFIEQKLDEGILKISIYNEYIKDYEGWDGSIINQIENKKIYNILTNDLSRSEENITYNIKLKREIKEVKKSINHFAESSNMKILGSFIVIGYWDDIFGYYFELS